jgi:hypothetical protein
MRVGLSFRQTMRGSYWRLDAPTDERAIALSIKAETPDIRSFARQKAWGVSGRIDAEGLASEGVVDGTIVLRLIDERRVTYRFGFRGDDGRPYELSGVQEWSKLSPVGSLTRLSASLYDERDDEIGRASLRFDLQADWADWLGSFRLVWDLR